MRPWSGEKGPWRSCRRFRNGTTVRPGRVRQRWQWDLPMRSCRAAGWSAAPSTNGSASMSRRANHKPIASEGMQVDRAIEPPDGLLHSPCSCRSHDSRWPTTKTPLRTSCGSVSASGLTRRRLRSAIRTRRTGCSPPRSSFRRRRCASGCGRQTWRCAAGASRRSSSMDRVSICRRRGDCNSRPRRAGRCACWRARRGSGTCCRRRTRGGRCGAAQH